MRKVVIVGLGNPGHRYQNTLHNVGFKTVELIAKTHGLEWKVKKVYPAEVAKGVWQECEFHLVKPLTYMNLSGEAVRGYLEDLKLSVEDLLVIADDADLPLGSLRMRPFGGSGGQKGLKSIEKELNTSQFKRLRIGIGRSPILEMSLSDYVLQPQPEEVWLKLNEKIAFASGLLEKLAQETFDAVMRNINAAN